MEVMVAVSIFAIVVTVGIGALLTINNNYRKAQTERQAIDSLTYVLESMSRALRTAQVWDDTNTYGASTSSFSFKDQDGNPTRYEWVFGSAIDMTTARAGGAESTYQITPDNVVIDMLTFTPFISPSGNNYLQINIRGIVTNGRQESRFAFQTGVSKRTADQ